MHFDLIHDLHDLTERYPSPPRELTVGSPPLIYAGYAWGNKVVCIPAVKECIEILRKRGDVAGIEHLREVSAAHQKYAKEHKEFGDAIATAKRKEGVIERPAPSGSGGVVAPSSGGPPGISGPTGVMRKARRT